jgi:thymidylate synthase
MDVILCHDKNYGIGYQGSLPWNVPSEMRHFSKKTKDSVVLVGKNTYDGLLKNSNGLPLPGRIIIVLTRLTDVQNALQTIKTNHPSKKVFVIGGGIVYKNILENFPHLVREIHVSELKDAYTCDTFISPTLFSGWVVKKTKVKEDFTYKVYVKPEQVYLDCLKDILNSGRLSLGRNGITKSLFGRQMVFDLNKGFPLLTTKKMFFKAVIEELLMFLRGDTNTKVLEEKGINIWKGNTERGFLDKNGFTNRKEGMMGPMYGYQWRNFNALYDEETGRGISINGTIENQSRCGNQDSFDQLSYVIQTIKKDPFSRRIIMTTYNPAQAFEGVLFPCHSLITQFYVYKKDEEKDEDKEKDKDFYIDMTCYNRSQDFFLGVPFNIASSSLLLCVVAKLCGMKPGRLVMFLGDVHIYEEHYKACEQQLERIPYKFPNLEMPEIQDINDIRSLTYESFKIQGYKSHETIKAKMIA